jgi:hypothetical protein
MYGMYDLSTISTISKKSGLNKSKTSIIKWNAMKTGLKFTTSKDRKKYYEGLGKKIHHQSFKEREREIIAKIKNSDTVPDTQGTKRFGKNNKANTADAEDQVVFDDTDTDFFNKQRRLLMIEKKFTDRPLTPTAYHGFYTNLYKVNL